MALQSLLDNRKIYNINNINNKMKSQMVTIPKQEYLELKKYKRLDTELLVDITNGIKDVITGKVKEI